MKLPYFVRMIFVLWLVCASKPAAYTQNVLIAKSFGGIGFNIPTQMETQPNGTSFIIGNFAATFNLPSINTTLTPVGNQDIYVLKVDSNGDPLEAFSFGGPNFDNVKSFAIDASGNIYISGYFSDSMLVGSSIIQGNGGFNVGFLCKLSPSYSLIWSTTFASSASFFNENRIKLDNNGNVIMIGAFAGTTTFTGTNSITAVGGADVFCAKYSNAGAFQWVRGFGGTGGEEVKGLAIDTSNNIYIGGRFFSNTCAFGSQILTKSSVNINSNGFLIKLNPSGATLNLKQLFSSDALIAAIQLDSIGNMTLGGSFTDSLLINSTLVFSTAANEIFICKLDTGFQTQWITVAGVPMSGNILNSGIVLLNLIQNNSNEIFITGYYFGTAAFGPFQFNSLGGSNVFFAALDSSGNWIWAARAGGGGSNIGIDIGTDTAGFVYATGYFTGLSIFGTELLFPTAGGDPDIFYVKIGECDSALATIAANGPTSTCTGIGTQLLAPVNIGYTYKWLKNDTVIPFAIDTQYVANTPGNYKVIVTSGGCIDTSAVVPITVNPSPIATISAAVAQVCENQAAVSLITSPSGGILNGTGISGNNFNPAQAGPGTFTIQYTYTNTNNCSDSAVLSLQVIAKPVSLFASVPALCDNQTPITLNQGFPTGGQYFGTGITNNSFNPQIGQGSYLAGYRLVNTQGCADTTYQTITVNPAPSVSLAPLGFTCGSNFVFPLSGGSPSGGTFSGTAVFGSNFYPLIAGPGNYPIAYAFQAANGCAATSIDTIRVDPPTVTFATTSKICVNTPPFQLTVASPSGGNYQGPGVVNNQFDATLAGVGIHTIGYTFSNSCGTISDSFFLEVVPLPTVNLNLPNGICSDATPLQLTSGAPLGGIYSGTNVSGNSFSPNGLSLGFATINYSFTDSNSCASTAVDSLEIFGLPTVTLAPLTPICEDAANFILSNGTPTGGIFSGQNILAGTFEVSSASAGYSVYNYTYTDANGCSSNATDSILVVANPNPTIVGDASVCIGENVALSAAPLGLTFTWNSTQNTATINFTANQDSTITLLATDSYGCIGSDTIQLIVNPLPLVSAGNYTPFCADNTNILLLNGLPAGGQFSGIGVTANQFNPSLASVGNNWLYYSYTDANGCSASDSAVVTVLPLPVVVLSSLPTVCENTTPFLLTTGSPSGGQYAGQGISGSMFTPNSTGAISYSYTYVDSNACSSTVTNFVQVNPLPVITFSGNQTICEGDSTTLTANGSATYAYTWANGATSTAVTISPTTSSFISISVTDTAGCNSIDSALVTVNTKPSVNAGLYPAVCQNATPFALNSGTPSGGNYSVLGNTLSQLNPIVYSPGTLTLTYSYTAPNGCSSTDSTNLVVLPLPQLLASSTLSSCQNETPFTLNLVTPSGGIYTGNGILNNTFDPATLPIGYSNFAYDYTDTNNCTATYIDSIEIKALPTLSLSGDTSVCLNDSILLQANSNAIIFTWNTFGGNGANFITNALQPGSTVISVLALGSNGCSSSDSISAVVNALPQVTLAPFANVCANFAAVQLNGGLPLGGLYSGSNVSNDSLFVQSSLSIDLIEYTFVDSNGCQNTVNQSIVIDTLPSYQLSDDTLVCLGDSVQLSVSGLVSVNWSTGDTALSLTVSPTASTNYVIEIMSGNTCTVSDTIEITVALPAPITIDTIGTLCRNASPVSLAAQPSGGIFSGLGVQLIGNTYSFDPSAVGAETTQLAYSYITADGCKSVDSIAIELEQQPEIEVSSGTTYCENDTISIAVASPYLISWTDSLFGNQLTLQAEQAYTELSLSLIGNGCTFDSTLELTINPLPRFEFPNDTSLCSVNTLQLDGPIDATSYLWNTGETSRSLLIEGAYLNQKLNEFWLQTTSNEGCQFADTVTIERVYCNNTLEAFLLYPNPTSGFFILQYGSLETVDVEFNLYTAIGASLGENIQAINIGKNSYQFDLSYLSSGVYYLVISADKNQIVKEIVLAK